MIVLPSTDPSDIANAARCFSSCVPVGQQHALRTYLLTQVGNIATPPCITPTAPSSVGNKGITGSSIFITWYQPANSGSLIQHYIVYWGTTSGVYTSNSGLIPATPRAYNITGLNGGTTYYWAVQAVAFTGCVSALSAESHATTSGSPPVPALGNSLVHYWKLDELSSTHTKADSVGTANLSDAAANGSAAAAKINNGWVGGTTARLVAADSTVCQIAAGTSFTFSMWIEWQSSATYNNRPFLAKWGATGEFVLVPNTPFGNNTVLWIVRNGANNASVTLDTLYDSLANVNTFAHFVFGYDNDNQQIFTQVNNGARRTAACVGVNSFTNILTFNDYSSGGANNTGFYDEVGFWTRVLSTADVATLYNGGNAYALSNFYP